MPGTTGNTGGISALDYVGTKEMALPITLSRGAPIWATANRGIYSPTVTTVGDALGLVNTMDPDTLTQLQADLYAGHFYSQEYYGKTHPPIRGGEPDDATIAAYTRALRIAARGGQPLDQVIKGGTSITDITGTGDITGGLGGATTVPPTLLGLPSVEDVAMATDTIATKLLGRRATDSEKSMVADAISRVKVGKGEAQQDVKQAKVNAKGQLSFQELSNLWIQAGGDARMAPTMAAIALAESSGHPNSTNPTDNKGKQTSWGLWQISDGTHNEPANWNVPLENAKMAVQKIKDQGLGAWGTYTSGAYKSFLGGGADVAGTLSENPSVPTPGSDTGGFATYTSPPSPEAAAYSMYRQQNAPEVAAHDSTTVYGDMLRLTTGKT